MPFHCNDPDRAAIYGARARIGYTCPPLLAEVFPYEFYKIVPEGVTLAFSGSAETFKEAFVGLVLALVLGVVVAYMILGAQFNSRFPLWTPPQGRRLTFGSTRLGSYDIFEADVSGSGDPQQLLVADGDQIPVEGFEMPAVKNDSMTLGNRPVVQGIRDQHGEQLIGALPGVS